MANETIEDIKSGIAFYLTLDDQIRELTKQKNKISPTFYAMNSLTGGLLISNDVEQIYHRADTPEHIALTLWSKDIALQRRIDRLKQKQRLFHQCMGCVDVSKLQRDLQLCYVTELERQAYEAIGEVAYYLDEHRKTEERVKGFGLNEEQQAQMADLGNQLLNRIKELAL
ncbi:hypothetical protein [Ruoffia sp. FAM 20858]|uniref:hypothetical protein n=1 Tax=Ruoffia sp. FAM 20858 TaxID=3259516 RepID=UPI0038899AAF